MGLACPVGWHFWGIGLMLLGCRGACFVTLPFWEQEDKSWWEKASGNPNRLPAAFRETRTKITTSRHTQQQQPGSVLSLSFCFEGKFAFPLARLKAASAEQRSWCLLSFNARQHSENIKKLLRGGIPESFRFLLPARTSAASARKWQTTSFDTG